MFDCANVEMRELLPGLAAGTLDGPACARVEAHVASCAECASELETLRLVRAAFGNPPAVDTARIVAALPKPPKAPPTRVAARPVKPWIDWRIAAALTVITVGGLSVAVTQRMRTSQPGSASGSPAVVDSGARSGEPLIADARDTGRAADSGVAGASAERTSRDTRKAQLSFGGGVGDLDAASIEALMGALEEIDRAPVAPSAEPDRTPLLPVIGEGAL